LITFNSLAQEYNAGTFFREYKPLNHLIMATKGKQKSDKDNKKEEFPGYPIYPESEDIYSRNKEETDLDPENPDRIKAPNDKPDTPNEKDFLDDVSGGDLDVPGAELDDQDEEIGREDEENNFYSLGGDKD